MKKLLTIVTALFMLTPPVLSQQMACFKYDSLLEVITNQYNEEMVWSGLSGSTTYMIFENESTGTWTAIRVDDDVACLLTTGNSGEKT